MKRHMAKCFGVLLLGTALLMTGCGSTGKKGSGAAVEDRSISDDEMAQIDERARSSGVSGGDEFSASLLDDPNSPLSVRTVYFEYDSSVVRAEYRSVVEAHANFLASAPSQVITLEGHADERGSREYNLALGERRALAVRRQMALLGASAAQIRTVSYGEERPANDASNEESYALNRRVEIIY